MAPLQAGPSGPYRLRWMARAFSTRSRMAAEDSPGLRSDRSPNSNGGTSAYRSIRSNNGPESLPRYFFTEAAEHRHRPEGCPYHPHRQGFMAHTSIKSLG